MKGRKQFILIALAVLLLVSGCGAKHASYVSAPAAAAEMAYADDYEYYAEAPAAAAYGSSNSMASYEEKKPEPEPEQAAEYGKKIIYNGYMTIRADDPSEALNSIKVMCESAGGYLSSSYSRTNGNGSAYATATFRIPADKLEQFMADIATVGEQTESNISSDDITQSYYDIQARLNSAKAEEQQLLALYDKCESIEDILKVREQLASVRSQIESYQATINVWNSQVSYATLELTIRETEKTPVQEKKPLIEVWKASDVWNKMKTGVQNSGRFLLNALYAVGIFLAYLIVPVVILGGIGVGLYFLFRPAVRKHREKVRARQEQQIAERERRKAERAKKSAESAQKAVPDTGNKEENQEKKEA